MPNTYEPFDPSHEFTWTAPPAANGNGKMNGHAPAPANGNGNGHHVVPGPHERNGNGPPARDDLEFATGSVLLFAQRVADDTIADARREAQRILDEARAALPAPATAAPTPPTPPPPPATAIDEADVAELCERAEQLRVESRLRSLLMNDLVECVAELSTRVEREIGDAMQMLEHARERALADFSAINALARLAGLPPDAQPEPGPVEPSPPAPVAYSVVDKPGFSAASDAFVIDLRDALDDDRNQDPHDEFDALFATRGVYMESRETRRSRWIRSAGLFSTVLGNRAGS